MFRTNTQQYFLPLQMLAALYMQLQCTCTAGLILSVQSNQFVQSKTQIVQSNTRNCAV